MAAHIHGILPILPIHHHPTSMAVGARIREFLKLLIQDPFNIYPKSQPLISAPMAVYGRAH
eukprot:1532740-Pyramimonas_sp.AAC.1